MNNKTIHITVCVCTYCRPLLLQRLLTELVRQDTKDLFRFSIVIVDNDGQQSAKEVVFNFISRTSIDITYSVEARKSISLARNKALEYAKGDAIAFIDDDEFPPHDWLFHLLRTLTDYDTAGVFGPVRPHFDLEPPAWLIKGRFFERPEHPTGFVMPWNECRTGNVLIKRQIIDGMETVFRPEFGSGASDINLFRRLIEAGKVFIWCNEAFVSEVVSPNRWTRSFMIKRALLRGKISLLHPEEYWINVSKSLLAVPAYGLALPFLQLLGHHLFMQYLVKFCDHAGRLLALVGLNPIQEREM